MSRDIKLYQVVINMIIYPGVIVRINDHHVKEINYLIIVKLNK